MLRRRVLLGAAIAVAMIGAAGPALAQDVPAPAECTIAPLDPKIFAADLAAAAPATLPAHAASESDLPAGAALDPAAARAVAAVVRMYVACANAGDVARQLALLTPGALFRAARPHGTPIARAEIPAYADEIAVELATPGPPRRSALLAVRGGRVLADGRAGVVVVGKNPDQAAAKTDFFVLAKIGGAWRIDEVIVVDAAAAAAATPGG